jgi:RecJ-like exonuclease
MFNEWTFTGELKCEICLQAIKPLETHLAFDTEKRHFIHLKCAQKAIEKEIVYVDGVCQFCDGKGEIEVGEYIYASMEKCKRCGGKGKL